MEMFVRKIPLPELISVSVMPLAGDLVKVINLALCYQMLVQVILAVVILYETMSAKIFVTELIGVFVMVTDGPSQTMLSLVDPLLINVRIILIPVQMKTVLTIFVLINTMVLTIVGVLGVVGPWLMIHRLV